MFPGSLYLEMSVVIYLYMMFIFDNFYKLINLNLSDIWFRILQQIFSTYKLLNKLNTRKESQLDKKEQLVNLHIN